MQNEKVMIITGGSSGIGRAAALRFANQGDKVLITGRRGGPVEQTVAEHKNIAGIVANTASAEDARRTIATAVDNWGRVDALVNNAGAGAILSVIGCDSRSDHRHLFRQCARSEPAGPRRPSSPEGDAGHHHQHLLDLRSPAGGGTIPLRRQQGGAGTPDPLLGAGACATRRTGERRRGGAHGIRRSDWHDGTIPGTGCGDQGTGARAHTARAARRSG